jgi:competence protein ComEA
LILGLILGSILGSVPEAILLWRGHSCRTNQKERDVIQENGKKRIKMNILRDWHILPFLLMAALTSCTQQQPSPQEIKEKTAEATAEAKRDAKAVAEGIKEGWNRNKPLDLNTATREQLVSLPGMTAAEADRVIAGRPYNEPGELVRRHIMSKPEYDKIADQVNAKK